MTWGAVAGAAVSVVGGMMAGDASGEAANAQSQAAAQASAIQEAARVQQRADLKPWMEGGVSANNALLYRLGLGGSASGSSRPQVQSRDQLRNQLVGQYTKQNTITTDKPFQAKGWEDLASYNDEVRSGNRQPQQQTTSTVDEAALNAAIDQQLAQQAAAQAQWEQAAQGDSQYGSLLKKFDQNDLNSDLVYQNTYKTALDTGLNAINSRAANSGGYGSGAALKAMTRFGADTANTYTGGAYNRNMQEKGQTYNFLSGVSQQGQSAAAGVGAAGLSTANGMANNALAAGNAQSAGIIGGSNALMGGISDATNAFQWNQLMSKPKTTASSSGWGTGSLYGNQDLGSFL